MRSKLHYLISYIILSFYGGAVCPFIESLGLFQFSFEIGIVFVLGWFFRLFLLSKISSSSPRKIPALQYKIETIVFFCMGTIVMLYNSYFYNFPLGSGVKVIVGTLCAAFFVGADLALEKEFAIYSQLQNRSIDRSEKKSTIARSFSLFATLTILLVAMVMILVIAKDFQWIHSLDGSELKKGILLSLMEVFFVLLVFLFWIINLIFSFSRNLKLFFQGEANALQSAMEGRFDTFVPVLKSDEFGTIASYTNEMILELQEKKKIREIFGKIVSPEVSNRLLTEGLSLKGKEETLVIVFIDIRNFTSISETLNPAVLVKNLNRYFTEVVGIIHKYKGEVDKFIGDGILAYWGLGSSNLDFIKNAVYASREILDTVEILKKELEIPLAIGIGMDFGKVIAGNIGSLERLEFTVVGNTVNTAARLESLCKEILSPIVISESLFQKLPKEITYFQSAGEFQLKGKSQAEKVYCYENTKFR